MWPLVWAVSISTFALYQSSVDATLETGWTAWALPLGFMVWVVIFFLLPKPFRTYVLGHELTHALWALMMGSRVGKIKVGSKGGHVELSKTNFIITLAPYFFPFYTALTIATYYVARIWLDVQGQQLWWLALVGLTWSFHITFTIHMLSQYQPDVQEHGRVFSYTVIYIMNVLVIALLLVLLGESRLLTFGDLLGHETALAYKFTAHQLGKVWFYCTTLIERLK